MHQTPTLAASYSYLDAGFTLAAVFSLTEAKYLATRKLQATELHESESKVTKTSSNLTHVASLLAVTVFSSLEKSHSDKCLFGWL